MSEFLTDFPYDIRRVAFGAYVEVLHPTGTLTACRDELLEPVNTFGWSLIGCITIISPAFPIASFAECANMAREELDKMPNLGTKLVVSYRDGAQVFERCFLVTTCHSDWPEKYPLMHRAFKVE